MGGAAVSVLVELKDGELKSPAFRVLLSRRGEGVGGGEGWGGENKRRQEEHKEETERKKKK